MAKYYGKVGYVRTVEKIKGVYIEEPTERHYYGDTQFNKYRLGPSSQNNPGISPNVSISIVADEFAIENTAYLRYAEYNNQFWDITSFEMQYPRIILSLGGVYNGKQA